MDALQKHNKNRAYPDRSPLGGLVSIVSEGINQVTKSAPINHIFLFLMDTETLFSKQRAIFYCLTWLFGHAF